MNHFPRNISLIAGTIITVFFVGIALLARFWTPFDPAVLSIVDKLQAPSAHHWFGTDQLGRDVLSLVMAGAQTSVGVALLSVVIGLSVGVPAGLSAAAHRGPIDELVMRGNDLIFAFPALLLAILITAVFGPGAVNAIIAIGIFNIPVFARVTRAGALQLWTRDYTLAARVAGKGPLRISYEHVLPNLAGLLLVQGTIQFSLGVIAEAGLAYVGLSAQPPTPSWGRMLNEAQTLTALAPFLALFPGFAVLLFVLGLNLLGEGLRRRAEFAMTPPLLEIADLHVAVGAGVAAARTQIIRHLSLQVQAGEILGLVGASGSGKSMTALAIMRLLPLTATMTGTVRLRGETLTGKSPEEMQEVRGRDIGMVFQEPMTALNPLMRVGDQVAETLRLHRSMSKIEARAAARETMGLVGLPGDRAALDRFPYELSGGQRQRVAIAMAAVMTPPLLIADEPTTALDVITQAQVLSLLQELVSTRNMGMILVTHDLAVVAQRADRVAVMQRGEIVEQGATADVIRRPQHSYTRALLAAASLNSKRSADRGANRSANHGERSSPVLQACGIVHEYPRRRTSLFSAAKPLRAVDGVSLSVHAGEIVGLVGESGSGKSSLLRVILALERSTAGQVRVLGEDFAGAELRRLRRAVQAVFQDPYGSFDPRWSVEELIAEPFFLLNSPPSLAERRNRVANALEQVGLSPADARRLPREFSGGERQRIAIARALITEPAVIAFDEAVSALDVLLRDQILELLSELARRLKVAYLFVSHDLHVIRAIADRVYVMQQGRIVEEGFTDAVFDSPRHAYTRALIAATPRVEVDSA